LSLMCWDRVAGLHCDTDEGEDDLWDDVNGSIGREG
jgi:hypothetical protein